MRNGGMDAKGMKDGGQHGEKVQKALKEQAILW